jgi:replicative DNA helicase
MREQPKSLEYEKALLGGLLLDPVQLPLARQLVRPEDFYLPEHTNLYTLLIEMEGARQPIDLVTVPERLAREKDLGRFGGLGYVLGLADAVSSTANLLHYAEGVKNAAMLRTFIRHTEEMTGQAYDRTHEVGRLVEETSQRLFQLAATSTARSWQRISEVIDDELVRVQALANNGAGSVTGIQTGFSRLDEMTAGMQRGDMIVLAARPSMGKTALALNLAQNAALLSEVAVGIFSLEMGREQLVARMLCTQGEVDATRLRTGNLRPEDWSKLDAASEVLRRCSIHIDDTPGITLSELRGRARRLSQQEPKLGLIVIDYLQLMQADDPRIPRTQQVSDISRGLKALAKDLRVPVVALSQLNRGVEERADKRPLPSDLRESGAIEQDADVILFIYRDDYYNKDSADKGLAEVIIAKQRNGPTGTVKLAYMGQFARFDDWAGDR